MDVMDGQKRAYDFLVNSFGVKAEYYAEDIDGIFIPLAYKLDGIRRKAKNRIIVYLAGPCGAGKTTMSLLLEHLINEHTESLAQAAGLDGFHYKTEYQNSHYIQKNGKQILMREIKGSAETYDFDKLYDKINAIKRGGAYFPRYSRIAHDVEEDAVFVDAGIVIIEGNWLLLDEAPWRGLERFADYRIFIGAPQNTLMARLTERKIAGGKSKEEARRFVERSDAENIERILSHRLDCDMELKMDQNGRYAIIS